jgi:DNA polymerase III delta prime subunit
MPEPSNAPDLDFIFIAGAPGTGKSTLAAALHERLGAPYFEFGWIPEFRLQRPDDQAREEQLSFENLCFVIRNYVRHGYRNVTVTDLNDIRFREIPRRFARSRYAIVTLVVEDDAVLKARVLDEARSSGYRDWEAALRHNRLIHERPLLPGEVRLDNTRRTLDELLDEALRVLGEAGRLLDEAAGAPRPLPAREMFSTYL